MIIREKIKEQPTPGIHTWAFAGYADCGVKQTRFGPKDTVRLFGPVDQPGENGFPIEYEIYCTKILGSARRPSKLREILAALSHPQPVPTALDLDNYIGRNCRLILVAAPKEDGFTYSNYKSCGPADPSAPWLSIANYKPTETYSDNPDLNDKVRRSVASSATSFIPAEFEHPASRPASGSVGKKEPFTTGTGIVEAQVPLD